MHNDSLDYSALISGAYRQRNQVVGDMIAAACHRIAALFAQAGKQRSAAPQPRHGVAA
ncbi:hypothetical protein [Azoarcus olearius]|uniref:Uncharacterized protein n=1 Tax=Azoarcus sp. (strain BH72) TaxID=418699 RepID=A1KBM9_AZOSB|nr:hypothetical protein [Azoarcus olearius]CAL96235.1 hypothetical protein predicted by Glimmer/Critica [Azoarcus olearius]